MTRWTGVLSAIVLIVLLVLCGCGSGSETAPRVRELDVDAPGVTLHVRAVGEADAEAVLIAIHGGPGNSSDYMVSLEELAGEELRVVNYDQRGTGRSSEPVDGYSMDRYIEDLDVVRSAVGAERVHLLGHSWGGVVALRYAAANPQHVRSIVLMGSGPMTPAALAAGQANLAERIASLQAQGLIPVPVSTVTDLLPAYFSDPGFEMPDELWGMSYRLEVQQATWEALEGYDHAAGLDRLTCEVLVVYGDDDPFGAALAEAARNALAIARVQTVVLEACGHYWHEAPGPFFDAVGAFLTGLTDRQDRETG